MVTRLTPAASSRKLLVLEFVRGYFARFECSPTVAEIAADQGVSPPRVREVLEALERDGAIQRIRGIARGIVLPERIALALQMLQDAGWRINSEAMMAAPPSQVSTLRRAA